MNIFLFCIAGNDQGYPSTAVGHFNFSSTMYLEDTVTVPFNDPHSCSHVHAAAAAAGSGVFYLAVYGFSNSAYTLSAMHAGGVMSLVPGVPVKALVYKGASQLYQVRMGYESADLTMQLMPEYGDADLYVKMDSALYGQASRDNYDFKSYESGEECTHISPPLSCISVIFCSSI